MLPFPIFVAPFCEFIIINASFKLTIRKCTFSLKNILQHLAYTDKYTEKSKYIWDILYVLLLSMYFLLLHINLLKFIVTSQLWDGIVHSK